jgi:hypothetical protein
MSIQKRQQENFAAKNRIEDKLFCGSVRSRGLAFGNLLHQRAKRRILIADDVEGEKKDFAQITDPDPLIGPTGDLPQRVLRPKLFDLHADDLGQSGSNFLRDASLIRREIEPDKSDHERPVRIAGVVAPDNPSETHEDDKNTETDVNRLKHGGRIRDLR